MAVIMQIVHDLNLLNELKLTEGDNKRPYMYIDSINEDCYAEEMHGICIRFIRETTTKKTKIDDRVFTRIDHNVKEEKDVSNKNDGYYYTAKVIVTKEKNTTKESCIFDVYEKSTYIGYFSTYPTVKKLFTLTCIPTSKVIPKYSHRKQHSMTSIMN